MFRVTLLVCRGRELLCVDQLGIEVATAGRRFTLLIPSHAQNRSANQLTKDPSAIALEHLANVNVCMCILESESRVKTSDAPKITVYDEKLFACIFASDLFLKT